MVSAMRCRAACSFVDSEFHRSTTSRNRTAATPPHTDGDTLVIRPMNDCNIARISSLRLSVLPATADMSSKSVVSGPPPGVVIRVLPCRFARYEWLDADASLSVPSMVKFLEHRVCGSNCPIAYLAHSRFASTRALAPDGDPQRPIDQHEPRDLMVRPHLAIRHHSPVESAVGRIEVNEGPVRLLPQRAAQ